jgi:hypothetical protein
MAQIEMIIDSVRRNSLTDQWSIILKERGAERYLPIYVGSPQASLVAKQLQGVGSSELGDYVFSLTGIDTTKSKVESVIINGFDNNIFYARLLLSQHDKPREVDCPPAIALALGVRVQAPIFAEEAVLDKAGVDVPA